MENPDKSAKTEGYLLGFLLGLLLSFFGYIIAVIVGFNSSKPYSQLKIFVGFVLSVAFWVVFWGFMMSIGSMGQWHV